MRVRILRGPSAGRVVDLPDAEALALLQDGLVEEDKQLSPPTETTEMSFLPKSAPVAPGSVTKRGRGRR